MEYWCLLENGELHKSVWTGAFWVMGPFDDKRTYSSVSMYAEIKPPPLPGKSCCDEMFEKTKAAAVEVVDDIKLKRPSGYAILLKAIDALKNMEKPE